MTAASKIRQLFQQGTDAFNRHDAEGFAQRLADDVQAQAPGVGEIRGKQAVKAFYMSWLDAFPDGKVEISSVLCLDDVAVEEGFFVGTHRATLHGPGGDLPATGRHARVRYVQIARYRDDKIASFNLSFDRVEMLEQLGVMPSQEAEEASRQPGEQPGQGAHPH